MKKMTYRKVAVFDPRISGSLQSPFYNYPFQLYSMELRRAKHPANPKGFACWVDF
jgi:hypothetical protein